MKKLNKALLLMTLLLSACVKNEELVPGGFISAVMESEQTKTSVTDEGSFTWSAGDKVWLGTTSGGVVGTLSAGAGTSKAEFAYGTFFGELTGKAVYPYNVGHVIKDNELSMVLPASYDLGSTLSNTNALMYGVNIDGTVQFSHLAGVMRFKFKNVPAGTDRFQITLDKKVNGTFLVNLDSEQPIVEAGIAVEEADKVVTLNFTPLQTVSDIALYVPLPVGTYTSIGLDLWAGDQSVWTYSNTVTNTINRKTIKLMPTITLGGTVGGDILDEDSEEPVLDTVKLTNNLAKYTCEGYVLPMQTIGKEVEFGAFSTSYMFEIPSGAEIHIEPVSGGNYGFALCDVTDFVIEYTNNSGPYTFKARNAKTHLWVSVPKIGTSFYTIKAYEDCHICENHWSGKTIWWCGTSIPAGGYPELAGEILGASVINTAVGGSMCRANVRTGDYDGANISNITSALTMTSAEAETFILNYDNLKTLPRNPSWPESLSDQQIKRMRDASFEVKILPYLDGRKPMPDLWIIDHGHNDWKYRDSRGDIDIALAPTRENIDRGELAEDIYMTETIDGVPYARLQSYLGSFENIKPSQLDDFVCSLNRNCYYGALNFMTTLILVHNPQARFMMIGNYSNEYSGETGYANLVPAQKAWAAEWCFPFCDIASCFGTSQHIIPGTQNWNGENFLYDTDVFHIYCPDGVHPSSDGTTHSLQIYAGIIAEFIKQHR